MKSRRFSRSVCAGSALMVAGALFLWSPDGNARSLVVGGRVLGRAAGADKHKHIQDMYSCAEWNAFDLNAVGEFGCTTGTIDLPCIRCHPPGGGEPAHMVVLTDPNQTYPVGIGMHAIYQCGQAMVGLCMLVNGEPTCTNFNPPVVNCREVWEYEAQPIGP